MPLDADEEDQFRRIVTQLREEDPSLGQRTAQGDLRQLLARSGPALVLLAALIALPVALALGLYPLGLVGYVVATLAAVRLADRHLPRRSWARAPALTSVPSDDAVDDDRPAANGRNGLPQLPRAARVALLAGLAMMVVVAMSSNGVDSTGVVEDPPAVPTAPAADGPTEGSVLDEERPASRRSTGRSNAGTDAATP